ncbi:MAG: acyltransferase [Desulfobulbaceae bacterium]|nr:acyltransferase [Desulfobulbaceae bacterium]
MIEKGGIQQELTQSGTLRRYRSTVIGNKGCKEFLLYEFTTTVICPLPAAFGMYARRIFMPLLFKNFGRQVTMDRDVAFRRPNQIRIGNGVILEQGVTLDVKSNGGCIVIHDDVQIGRNTILSCPGGVITVGRGTLIGRNCRLGSLEGLTIGRNTKIEDFACIVGAGHSYSSSDLPIIQQPLTCKGPTVIEDKVVIEQEATVLDGLHIGENARIAAGSLVNTNVAPNSRVRGIPASPWL